VLIHANGTKVTLQNGQLLYENEQSTTIAHHVMTTPRARQFQLLLPDGTKVWLNCASSIRYPTIFSEQHRTVEITGEAYFEVAQNAEQPFLVKLPGNIEVQVLGTSFNVNAYADEPSTGIVLISGSVALQRHAQRILLKPGEKGTVEEDGIRVSTADVEEAIAWKNGQFQVSGANLPLLFHQLSRWYDVEIRIEGTLPGKSFTTSISRNDPLTSILKALEIYGIHSKMENGKVVFFN
jgi:ferric-dicitrate binding protein FerR (iron transport regulator)